jgi:anti-sigma regulatory factor (Ser/Thr protein kinase)
MILSAAQDQRAVLARTNPLTLGPIPTSPRTARASVVAQLTAWGRDDLAADAEAIVSELVTNAVRESESAGSPIGLRLILTTRSVFIEVLDYAPGVPAPREADPATESGRGLLIVSSIARDWGWTPAQNGKITWAEVAP